VSLSISVTLMPHPKDYMSHKVKTFNGKQGNGKDHIMKFIMTLIWPN
jgi:hypothetical protein